MSKTSVPNMSWGMHTSVQFSSLLMIKKFRCEKDTLSINREKKNNKFVKLLRIVLTKYTIIIIIQRILLHYPWVSKTWTFQLRLNYHSHSTTVKPGPLDVYVQFHNESSSRLVGYHPQGRRRIDWTLTKIWSAKMNLPWGFSCSKLASRVGGLFILSWVSRED